MGVMQPITTLTKEVLEDLYTRQRLTARQISQRYECSEMAVTKWLKRHGIPIRHGKDRLVRQDALPRELFEALYLRDGLSLIEIATRYGYSRTTLRSRCIEWGILRREQWPCLVGRVLGKLRVLRQVDRPANAKEKGTYWECECECGKRKVLPRQGLGAGVKSCGCARHRVGFDHPCSKGWRIGADGYVTGRPHAAKKEIKQHRYVMEQVIGRPLTPDETVHHKNGIRHDNRPENLELWCSRHSRGQRVSDLVKDALDVLKKYAPERLSMVS